jgi:hypothetical protein
VGVMSMLIAQKASCHVAPDQQGIASFSVNRTRHSQTLPKGKQIANFRMNGRMKTETIVV